MTKDIIIGLAGMHAAFQETEPSRFFFVIDKRVYELYSDRLPFEPETGNHLICEASEGYKSIEQAELIWNSLLDHQYTKKDVLIAIGGGIIGDIAGLAASCYKRGMRFVLVPTTLLAMTDSSIGFKTAVNHRSVKNSIGSYYMAEKRIVCYDFLASLPKEELLCGLAEMIKIAAIYNEELFGLIEKKGFEAAMDRDCIERAMELKKAIVREDPFEENLRKILNFGHTIGHALEAYLWDHGKREIKHGYAVAYGMMAEVNLGLRKGLVNKNAAERLKALMERCGFDFKTEIDNRSLLPYLLNDKKRDGRGLVFALMTDVGKAELVEWSEREVLGFH